MRVGCSGSYISGVALGRRLLSSCTRVERDCSCSARRFVSSCSASRVFCRSSLTPGSASVEVASLALISSSAAAIAEVYSESFASAPPDWRLGVLVPLAVSRVAARLCGDAPLPSLLIRLVAGVERPSPPCVDGGPPLSRSASSGSFPLALSVEPNLRRRDHGQRVPQTGYPKFRGGTRAQLGVRQMDGRAQVG